MESEGTVTQILARLKEGDPSAAQSLWESYFAKLVVLARARLHATVRRVSDEEDVALSVFESFCRRAGNSASTAAIPSSASLPRPERTPGCAAC